MCSRPISRSNATLVKRPRVSQGSRATEPIATPVIEDADLFVRGVGDGTDIVEKEMYLFDDRGGDRLALRPESTGGGLSSVSGARIGQ